MKLYDTGHEIIDELKKLHSLLGSITEKFTEQKEEEEKKERSPEEEEIFQKATKREENRKYAAVLAIASLMAVIALKGK